MSSIRYRPEIDGLRAIAVSAVVIYHAGFGLRAGQVGVDVFFVISGYLITSLLWAEEQASGRIDLFAFYARRVRRILPALVVVVLATVAASACLLSPYGEIKKVTLSGIASLLFAANIFFQAHTGGYFDSSADRLPLLHLWSLGVEEQFYLLWPLGLLLLLRLRRQWVVPAVGLCGALSLGLAEVLLYVAPNAAFYEMPARFWELALGGLVALRPRQELADGAKFAGAGVLLVLASTALPIVHFPGVGALPAVLGAGLLIYAVHGSTQLGWAGALLRSRVMVFLGLISYSLYLWHWPLLALAHATHQGTIPVAIRAGLCAVAVLLAWMSYRWVEQPLRRPDPKVSARQVVAAGLAMSAALCAGLFSLGNFMDEPAQPTDLASVTESDQPANRVACNFQGGESLDSFPRPGCSVPAGQPVRVAIWGDSHALAWEPFAWAIAQHDGVAATAYIRDACAPSLGWDNGKHALEANRCRQFNQLVLARIDGLDTLVFSAYWPNESADTDFNGKFAATLARVVPKVRRVILLGPTPFLHDSVPLCIRSHNLAACAITRSQFDAQALAQRNFLRALAAKYSNVEYVDLTDFFCDAIECPPVRDGYGLYWDSNHVASTAARKFAAQYLARSRPSVAAPQNSGGSRP